MKLIKVETTEKKTLKNEVNEYVVASTKTQNILVNELKESGHYVDVLKETEFYLDREVAIELGKIASDNVGIDISESVIKALEIACIVKRLEK